MANAYALGEAASRTTVQVDALFLFITLVSLVFAAFFYYGYRVFRDIRTPSPGATDIHAVGRQWLFEFRYPDGRSSINELRVPAGRPRGNQPHPPPRGPPPLLP